ncbi:40S ribosomal protein S8-like protein [Tanacetum coccineum]|uniref:40S ribosomal protein S8 n=1 Tax=Tanacetum coccineum TaxID=301880 RepID=A0ABQ5FVM4_9ASTR
MYSSCICTAHGYMSISTILVTQIPLGLGRNLDAQYKLGRQPANTNISSNKTVRRVRVRGGNIKWRALRLDTGNYSWGSEAVTRKTRILDVVYNASNNELVRTQTLVKGGIEGEGTAEEAKHSNHVQRKIEKRQEERKLDAHVEDQFNSGWLYACISSRQGQCGRADGELEFYMKKLQRKNGKGAGAA